MLNQCKSLQIICNLAFLRPSPHYTKEEYSKTSNCPCHLTVQNPSMAPHHSQEQAELHHQAQKDQQNCTPADVSTSSLTSNPTRQPSSTSSVPSIHIPGTKTAQKWKWSQGGEKRTGEEQGTPDPRLPPQDPNLHIPGPYALPGLQYQFIFMPNPSNFKIHFRVNARNLCSHASV